MNVLVCSLVVVVGGESYGPFNTLCYLPEATAVYLYRYRIIITIIIIIIVNAAPSFLGDYLSTAAVRAFIQPVTKFSRIAGRTRSASESRSERLFSLRIK